MGHRAGRWLTQQVGEYRRAVSVVAAAFLKTTADQRFGPASPSHGAAGRTLGSCSPHLMGEKGHKPHSARRGHHIRAAEGLTAPLRPSCDGGER